MQTQIFESCDMCGEAFSDPDLLNAHYVVHAKRKAPAVKLECLVCGREFKQRSELVKHSRLHTGERPYSCNMCKATFMQKSHLMKHAVTHSRIKAFECPLCKKSYHSREILRAHVYCHMGERPYVCDVCQKKFSRNFQLKEHMIASHSDKTFECPVCKKSFQLMTYVRKHYKLTHTDECACKICKRRFANLGQVKRHYRMKHQVEYTEERPRFKYPIFLQSPRIETAQNEQDTAENFTLSDEHIFHQGSEATGSLADINESLEDTGNSPLTESLTELYKKSTEHSRPIKRLTEVTGLSQSTGSIVEQSDSMVDKVNQQEYQSSTSTQIEKSLDFDFKKPIEIGVDEKHMTQETVSGESDASDDNGESENSRNGFVWNPSDLSVELSTNEDSSNSSLIETEPPGSDSLTTNRSSLCNDSSSEIHFSEESAASEKVTNSPLIIRAKMTQPPTESDGEHHHVSSPTRENPQLECDMCSKVFSAESDLHTHYLDHVIKTFSCPHCKKCHVSEKDLVKHLKSHRRHTCDICSKVLSCRYLLERHRISHTGERPFWCDGCDRGFTQLSSLRKHNTVFHNNNIRDHRCDLCKKKFSRPDELRSHMNIHNERKDHKCDVCDKGFRTRQQLTMHSVVHTGERPYECDVCKRTFNQRVALIRHYRIHTGEKPYACDRCDRRFHTNQALRNHFPRCFYEPPQESDP